MWRNLNYLMRTCVNVGLFVWICWQSLFGQTRDSTSTLIILRLPHLSVPITADTVVVPLDLRNTVEPVAGLQLDLLYGRGELVLDSVVTTERTLGWQVDILRSGDPGSARLLLFDPTGHDISPGVGPVMELVFLIPGQGTLPDSIPLVIQAVTASDPIGEALAAEGRDGSLSIGSPVMLSVGQAVADQGEQVRLDVQSLNAGWVASLQLDIFWEPDLLELEGLRTTERTAGMQLDWNPIDQGAHVWLHAQAGQELRPGKGSIMELAFRVDSGTYSDDIDIYLRSAQVIGSEDRERSVTHLTPGGISVFPGYLDPPGYLLALSGQDGRVPLNWVPPDDGTKGGSSLLLVDDDASVLGPPYRDVGGQMADDLAGAGYTFDYFIVPVGADGPGPEVVRSAQAVIWVTGYEWGYHPTLTPSDQATLAAFLQDGGKVWLIGQDIIWDIGDSFIRRHFGGRLVAEDIGTPEVITGSAGSVIEDAEYPVTTISSEFDHGDAIAPTGNRARGLIDGLSRFGAVTQKRTAFWALEFANILNPMDRIELIHGQLTAFGIATSPQPGCKRILAGDRSPRYAPRAPSPLKAEALSMEFTALPDSLTPLPQHPPIYQRQMLPLTGYSIYRDLDSLASLNTATRLATVGVEVPAYVDSSAANNQTYAYAVTALYGDRFESDASPLADATPADWVNAKVGRVKVMAGDHAVIPVALRNEEPVLGVRFVLSENPAGHLSNPRAVLGDHAPPDWLVTLEHDTLAGELAVVSFSPALSAIPPGEGDILVLLMDTEARAPVDVALDLKDVVVSGSHGDALRRRVENGSLFLDIQLAQLRMGSRSPTQPGDTGYISIFMDNPRPVMAFQLVVQSSSDKLHVVNARGTSRLPEDAHIAYSSLGSGAVRLIESSFSNVAIAAGSGPIATIGYWVPWDIPEGLIGLEIDNVVLTDERGQILRQRSISGSFPVGEVRSVFAPVGGLGQPGRTVTSPVSLTNAVDICEFELELQFDSACLTYLSYETRARLPYPSGLTVAVGDTGLLGIRYASGDQAPILKGSGPLLDVIFLVDAGVSTDTSLVLAGRQVSAASCSGEMVFALGQDGEVVVGKSPPMPRHFKTAITPSGVTHFIQVQAVTLGGEYLDPGDELAVMDSAAWIDSQGLVGPMVAGAGVVGADGSVNISAVMGFQAGSEAPVLPGARSGGTIYYLAWDKTSDYESKPGTDARYVLGEGVWGENNGLTIVQLVRVPGKDIPAAAALPEALSVESHRPHPFDSTTVIRFGLPRKMQARVAIFDLMGREVVTLHDGLTAAGFHEVNWLGTDRSGAVVPNGMYFCQIRTTEETVTRKLLLMR